MALNCNNQKKKKKHMIEREGEITLMNNIRKTGEQSVISRPTVFSLPQRLLSLKGILSDNNFSTFLQQKRFPQPISPPNQTMQDHTISHCLPAKCSPCDTQCVPLSSHVTVGKHNRAQTSNKPESKI